jgi:hypothetical protein
VFVILYLFQRKEHNVGYGVEKGIIYGSFNEP